MERININYPEEKVLRLFTAERRPLTAAELLDYLKSLEFGGGQYILQSLLRKKLLASKSLSDGTLLHYPSHQAYYYYAKSGGLRDDSIEVDNKELRQMTVLLEQLDTVEEAKRSLAELKLRQQRKVIDLWQAVAEHQPTAPSTDAPRATDDEELDSSALVIEVQDSGAYTDDCDTHPELNALNERKIAQLHRYNEIKDFAHVLLGALAEEQLSTVKELYRVFSMEV